MAKPRPPARGVWDEEGFVDISSHSTGEPPQRARPLKGPSPKPRPQPQQRPAPAKRPRPAPSRPDGRKPPPPPGRPKRPTRPNQPRPQPGQRNSRPPRPGEKPKRPPQPRKRRPPMKKGLRRLLMLGTLLAMLAVTCLLAISLLFKISEITVTGDLVYQTQDILNLCDYQIGDNLFFVTTADRVKKLKSQLPYIADVDIRRHIPGTLEIHITGTQIACSIYTEGQWLYVSGEGKILEIQADPREGVMRIEGLSPKNPQVGARVQLEDKGIEEAYSQILAKIVELGAWGEFTRLDITDPYNITLWYQDRVECKLGNGAELDYKVQFGYKLLREGHIGPEETGVLDLSYADVRRAGFTSQAVDPSSPSFKPSEEDDTGVSYLEWDDDTELQEDEETDSEEPQGRANDIPDTPLGG